MPARKTTKAASSAARGPVPPYGIAIKEALARGDAAEMRKVAASARKHLNDVEAALAALEKAIGAKRR